MTTTAHAPRPLAFGLYYFGNDDANTSHADQRRLILDSARFADEHGFSAVWSPERHFHAFGGLSPNPSVMAAALATVTKRVRIRSGSVVVPLHHPARVVEEWSMVDFLSGGRVDLALASGWFPNDFVLAAPGNYERRNELVFERVQELRRLWQGEPFEAVNPLGDRVQLHTMPRPVQSELPIWITAASNPQTFQRAGAQGLNILTHLLGQSVEALGTKIAAYRQARREAGHAGEGTVTLMLHTFVGEDDAQVRQKVKAPMMRYLASSLNLVGNYTAAVPFFQKQCPLSEQPPSQQDLDLALEYSFERYYATSSLLGTMDACLEMTERLRAIEVDEVACLIDFGVGTDDVLAALPALDELRQLAQLSDLEEEALA
ncbi:MAG TPA: MupA/Atu3671 family FMN-dependent luciferase-like monooxygenase [Rhizobacter sp.]|nr:MupA/Atu3671 family FMN-dependent luciferase-like monooxygenase [Rhizobacter sp.]